MRWSKDYEVSEVVNKFKPHNASKFNKRNSTGFLVSPAATIAAAVATIETTTKTTIATTTIYIYIAKCNCKSYRNYWYNNYSATRVTKQTRTHNHVTDKNQQPTTICK